MLRKLILVVFLCLVFLVEFVNASEIYELTAQPDEVQDLVLWLDADDLDGDGAVEGASESGLSSGVVSQWTDKSGQSNNATQTTSTYRPGYNTSAVNGRAAVTFNNNGQYLDVDLAAVDHTIFVVTQTGPTPIANNFGTLFVMNDGNVGTSYPNKRQPMIFLRDNNRLGLSYNDSSGVHYSYNFSAFTGFGLVCLHKAPQQLNAFLNGQKVYTASFEQTEIDGVDTIGRNTLNGNTYKGDVAEIIVYDRALEIFEVEQVSFYLQSKYNLSTSYDESFLALPDFERKNKAQAELAGLIEIDEVILPDTTNTLLDNDHFGHPVAAMSGSNIVVHCQQNLSHYTTDYDPESDTMKTSNSESNGFVVRSTDYGQNWSSPAYIKDLVSTGGGPNAGGMIAIGSDNDGDIILKHSYYPYGGCLWSGNGGSTWSHYNQAFANLTTLRSNLGPDIIDHPMFGLLMFSSQHTDSNNSMMCSANGGLTWTDRYWTSPTDSSPMEPTVLIWDNHILLISREFGDLVTDDSRYQMLSQHLYTYEPGDVFSDVEFVTKRTNIRGNLYSGTNSVWSHDTASVKLNPVTGRIELIDSHRWGGGLGDTGENEETGKSTLNLWSIDPNDLLAGSVKWRFDGTILERALTVHHGLGYVDGLHPGGAVIDPNNNMQHLFVYAGFSDRRTGVYRISRTLDTERLRQWTLNKYSTIWNFESWSSNKVSDDSGYALDADVEGTVSSGTGSTDYGSTGTITLDSTSNCVSYTDEENDFFDFYSNADFTLEALIKTSSNGTIVSKEDSDSVGWSMKISSGKILFNVEDDSNVSSFVTGSTTITDNSWHHVAAVRNDGVLIIYVDYAEDGFAIDLTDALSNDDDLVLGAMRSQSSEFIGQIDFFRLTRRALCSEEFLLPEDERGDADFSGKIDTDDLDIVDYYLGKTDTDLATVVGDFDCDGDVDSDDRQYVLDNNDTGVEVLPITDGLFVHLDSSNLLEQSGDITAWLDVAPLGGCNNAIIAGGSPQMATSGTISVVEFDGNDYFLIKDNDIFDCEDKTWFIVFEPDNTTQTGVLLRSHYDDRGDGIVNEYLWGTFLENQHYQSHGRTFDGTIRSASGGTVSTDWVLLSAVRNNESISEYIDGTSVSSVQGVTSQPFYHQKTAIGALVSGSSGFSGRIATIIVYNRALSDSERQAVETYLLGKAPL